MSERYFCPFCAFFSRCRWREQKPRKQTKAKDYFYIISKSRPAAKSVSPDPPVHPAYSYPRPLRPRANQISVTTPVAMFSYQRR